MRTSSVVFFVVEMPLAAIALALVAVGGVSCSWQNGDDGVDRSGGDLPNMPVNSVAGPSDCAAMCDKNSDCVAWAYGKSSCEGSTSTSCWLKNAVMPQSLNSCRVSAS